MNVTLTKMSMTVAEAQRKIKGFTSMKRRKHYDYVFSTNFLAADVFDVVEKTIQYFIREILALEDLKGDELGEGIEDPMKFKNSVENIVITQDIANNTYFFSFVTFENFVKGCYQMEIWETDTGSLTVELINSY